MGGFNDLRPKDGADNELRAGVYGAMNGIGVEQRASAENEIRRQRRRNLLDQFNRARHGHRHLEYPHTAFRERIDDGAQRGRVGHADDGHDADFFDFCDDFRSGSCCCHKRGIDNPPSTLTIVPVA